MITNVRHIIFDLGGVLLNLDYSLTEKAFKDLGLTNFNELFTQLKQTSLFDDLEKGGISGDEFLNRLLAEIAIDMPREPLRDGWNAMLLDFPVRRLQLLQQLRNHYDLFLLSNTNEIHELAFNEILFRAHAIPSIATFFDRVYYSHRLGMRKPDKEIFELILTENELEPEHTLFIDDSPQHIETAKLLGIQTIHLRKGMTIENDVWKGSDKF